MTSRAPLRGFIEHQTKAPLPAQTLSTRLVTIFFIYTIERFSEDLIALNFQNHSFQ